MVDTGIDVNKKVHPLLTDSSGRLIVVTTGGTGGKYMNESDQIVYIDGADYVCVDQQLGTETYRGADAAACIAAGLAAGKVTFIKDGTYTITGDIQMNTNNVLFGVPKQTILNFTADKAILTGNKDYIEVAGLKITGSGAISCINTDSRLMHYYHDLWFKNITSSIPCIKVYTEKAGGATFSNLFFNNIICDTTQVHGIQLSGGNTNIDTYDGVNLRNSRFTSCGDGTAAWTVGCDLLEHGILKNAMVVNSIFEKCWESGFHVEQTPPTENLQIINCISRDNGQKPSATYGSGFLFGGNTRISNSFMYNNKVRGIYTSGDNVQICNNRIDGNGLTVDGIRLEINTTKDVIISNNEFYNLTGIGIYAYYGIIGLIISKNIINTCTTYGIELLANTRTSIGEILGNIVRSAGSYGMRINAVNSNISKNYIDLSGYSGIYTDTGNNCIIANNVCKNNGQLGSSAYGINLKGNYHNVNGNRCYDDQGGHTQTYGIYYNASPDYCLIIGNILVGNGTGETNGSLGANSVSVDNL